MLLGRTFQEATSALDEVLVVKLGGGRGLNLDACLDDLAELAQVRPLVVVHGVSARMDALCAERGHPIRTLTSPDGHVSRYTDAATRDVFVEAAVGVNDDIARGLRTRGVSAAGFGPDAAYPVAGRRKDALRAVVDGRLRVIRDDFTGAVSAVDADAIRAVMANGCVAVLPPLAMSADGPLNVDGDRLSAAVASALGAPDLVILSNVPGLLRRVDHPDSLIAQVSGGAIDDALNLAQGRMKRKVLGASEALAGGVNRVVIGDGRATRPVQRALNGAGTVFCP
jgi:acetylglutamate/LysW-gamma-L-alpha-aminoadipate kinase